MRIKLAIVWLCTLIWINSVFAAQLKKIMLEDQTVIYGNVIGLENGIYKIKNRDMGLLSIAEEKVISISNSAADTGIVNKNMEALQFSPKNPADPGAVEAGVEALKRQMSNDPSTMQNIAQLQDDPDFMAVLNDPAIMSAISSGDIDTLADNPKFLKLMNNSAVKGIGSKVE
ncbi:MAG: hypothetical protein KKD05_09665 [Candidatus Omnitrophica bacterium]|nr:hypothetical protein [Candidatus Omnitrophota bacterium]